MVRLGVLIGLLALTGCSGPWFGGPLTYQQSVDLWKADLLDFGKLQCDYFQSGNGANFSTYYDAARAFYQTADYFGDSNYDSTPWSTCAELAAKAYRDGGDVDWTGQYGGGAAGWNAFTQGLRLHYERTGDQRSKDAVHVIATHGWAGDGGPTWGYPYAREIAYAIMNHLDDEALGAPHRARLDELVNTALEHFNQMFISKQALTNPYRGEDGQLIGITPFMVGLEAQAFIQYYDKYKDARILPMIKAAADVLYEEVTPLGMRIWDPQRGGFLYDTIWGGGKSYEPGLNLLVVPIYGWVYMMTGETKYRDRGEEIWIQGISRSHCGSVGFCPAGDGSGGNYLWFGKQFNQQYMWSFKFMEWRQ